MIQIRHQLPDRLRVRVPALGDRPQLAGPLLEALQRRPGVRQARANPACASLIVSFAPGTLDAAAIECCVRDLLEPRLPAPGAQSGGRRLGALRRGMQQRWKTLMARAGRIKRPRLDRLLGQRRVSPPARADRPRRRAAPPCRFCRLQQRLTGWMLRRTLRCWWQDLSQPAVLLGRSARLPQPQRS